MASQKYANENLKICKENPQICMQEIEKYAKNMQKYGKYTPPPKKKMRPKKLFLLNNSHEKLKYASKDIDETVEIKEK